MDSSSRSTIFVVLVISLAVLASAADPDPVLDFCIANNGSPGSSCRDPSTVSGSDFVSEILRDMRNTQSPNSINATLVTVSTFPGLNTMGLSIVRIDYGVGGVVGTHVHPRASELVYVVEGSISAGFVDSNNVLFSRTLQRGDMIILPRGLLHYQYNNGSERATAFAVFNSQEPGAQFLGPSLFGSGIPTPVLESSLSLDNSTIDALREIYAPSLLINS